ncbi:MAG: molybdenum cofactor biosynthesis protein MoaE, partial [Pseudomonadota bacterium]
AIVFFVGLVRDFFESESETEPQSVDYLELEHYPDMTEALCAEIIANAKSRFEVSDIHIVHRVGKLFPKDQIVFIGVAGAHRQESFLASQYVMDYLKTSATIWKKEVSDQGHQWLGVKDKDKVAFQQWQTDG